MSGANCESQPVVHVVSDLAENSEALGGVFHLVTAIDCRYNRKHAKWGRRSHADDAALVAIRLFFKIVDATHPFERSVASGGEAKFVGESFRATNKRVAAKKNDTSSAA